MRFSLLLFSFLIFFVTHTIQAQDRAKVGLVLSGGGAKGAAHIGVLKVLEQNNIPIDYIVGTSIGAYVGGLYALGYSADEIEDIMLNLPWDLSYSDFIPRESLRYTDKQLRDIYNISLRLGYSDGILKLPSGLLLGQTAGQLLRQSTDVMPTFNSFDDLAIPYRAVATDLATSHAVIIKSGSITLAMKASAAVPGALEPVEIDGKLLVDGGISNNMPVDVIRNMGADIIIAVDIGSPLAEKSDIRNTVDVLDQLSTIMTNTATIEQKLKLTSFDILIRPDIDDLSTTDFSIMDKALAFGKAAAVEQHDRLKMLSVSEKEFARYRLNKNTKNELWLNEALLPLVAVEYQNNSKVNVAIIKNSFGFYKGDVVDKDQLKSAIDRVYALDRFEQVSAEFVMTPQGRKLILTTTAKSWGPDFFQFGGSLQTDFSTNTIIALDFAYILTDITENGGLWKNEISLGWETMLATEFYQPIDTKQNFFARSRFQYAQDKWAASKNKPEIANKYSQVQLGLGFNYVNKGAMELGFIGETGDVGFDNYLSETFDYTSVGGYFTFGFDNLNSINFPTQGNKLLFQTLWRNDRYDSPLISLESEQTIEIKLDWRGAFTLGNHSFVGITSLATVEAESNFSVHISELGGFLNLSGYQKDALLGAHKVFSAVVYQYDLGKEVPGGSGLPFYLGTSLEIGNVWSVGESVDMSDLITSGSLFLGTDTTFGPVAFGFGFTDNGEQTVFLSLGKNW